MSGGSSVRNWPCWRVSQRQHDGDDEQLTDEEKMNAMLLSCTHAAAAATAAAISFLIILMNGSFVFGLRNEDC